MNTTSAAQQPVAVLGSGGWGTALAVHLGGLGKQVRLWGRDPALAAAMRADRENRIYLPAVELPSTVFPTSSLDEALSGAQYLISAVPSHGTRDVLKSAASAIAADAIIVSATKGLEGGTLLRMTEVIEQELGSSRRVTVLSGPSFSKELAQELPTAVCVGRTVRGNG